jgi:ribosomal protein S27AE
MTERKGKKKLPPASELCTKEELDDIRAGICPDCGEVGLEIEGDRLVCPNCGFFCSKERGEGSG